MLSNPVGGRVAFEVIDMLGRSVMHADVSDSNVGRSENVLNLGVLAPGAYVLRATTDLGAVATRFVRAD